jgi:hypothetical protein
LLSDLPDRDRGVLRRDFVFERMLRGGSVSSAHVEHLRIGGRGMRGLRPKERGHLFGRGELRVWNRCPVRRGATVLGRSLRVRRTVVPLRLLLRIDVPGRNRGRRLRRRGPRVSIVRRRWMLERRL